jgi:hypothetical protein
MVPDPRKTALGLEYFCTEDDAFWKTSDADLIEQGKRELDRLGLARYTDVEDGCVVRVPKAYPMYDSDYREHLDSVRQFVDKLENFQTIGRNGLHRYNNQDHAMQTGIVAARNIVLGEHNDVWSVNTDEEYHEVVREDVLEAAAAPALVKLDRVALGLALAAVSGLLVFVATLALVLKGGDIVGPNLGLLAQYFPGYGVTRFGSFVGLAYGTLVGFIAGWSFAVLRNALMLVCMVVMYRRTQRVVLRRLLDYL